MLQGLELAEWFAADSPLGASLDGFAPRAGQAEMAEAIAEAIAAGDNLVVEAGTGTGKTLAYLVPVVQRLLAAAAPAQDGPAAVVCVHERTASVAFLLTSSSQDHYNSFCMHESAYSSMLRRRG